MKTEKGNDELLAEVADKQQILEKVIDDDARRKREEEKVAAQPGDGIMG